MKYFLHSVVLVLISVSLNCYAQDKVFLRNGTTVICKISSITDKAIIYTDTLANSPIITEAKKDVLLVEYQSGQVYMFSKETPDFVVSNSTFIDQKIETREQRKARKMLEWKEKEALLPNNILGFYIPELILGRLTISYERLFANKSIGIKIPFSLTYDGLGFLAENSSNSSNNNNNGSNNNNSSNNTTNSPVTRNRGTGFITGVDVNYYHDLKPALKYYFGPRVRYGTDMTLGGIEGLTVQIQNGILKSVGKRFTSTLGIGVGFFKLSTKYSGINGYDSKQVYPWGSVTWRLGIRL